MKKIVLLLISLIIITGCSVKYNLVINDDLSIDEKAILTGTDAFFANYYKTTKKNVLKSLLEQYDTVLTENGYTYELIEEDKPYVNVNRKYSNINEFTNGSILFNDYFDEIKYTSDGNIKKIETIGYNPNNPDDPGRFDVKELDITIKCAYKVRNHNAKKVNKKTNTYYYELNEESDKILLEFDASKKFNSNEEMITTILICLAIVVLSWIVVYVLNKKKK